MESLKYYLEQAKGTTIEDLMEAKRSIWNDAKCDITEIIADYDEDDLVEWLKGDYGLEDIYAMDELNDVFDYMSPTEVLEELSDIDLCDAWFNSETKESSNSVFELIDIDYKDIAEAILEEEIEVEDDEIQYIIDLMKEASDAVEEYYNKYKKAKELFEQAIQGDINEVISVLWNMNA